MPAPIVTAFAAAGAARQSSEVSKRMRMGFTKPSTLTAQRVTFVLAGPAALVACRVAAADTIQSHQPGHWRSRPFMPSGSNNFICSGFLSSRDPTCPPAPPSGLMKEILGKQMGL